jgi:hypothetical protein
MISDFITSGTIGFVIFTILFLVFIIAALEVDTYTEKDKGGGFLATVIVIGAFVCYYFFGSSQQIHDLFFYFKAHIGIAIGFFLLYFVFGVVWSFFKWFFFLRRRRDNLLNIHRVKANGLNIDDIPLAKDNTNRLASWITYWPFSAIWTLLNDPVRKFVRFLVETFGGFYDRMSQSAFEGHVKH